MTQTPGTLPAALPPAERAHRARQHVGKRVIVIAGPHRANLHTFVGTLVAVASLWSGRGGYVAVLVDDTEAHALPMATVRSIEPTATRACPECTHRANEHLERGCAVITQVGQVVLVGPSSIRACPCTASRTAVELAGVHA